MHWNGSSWVAVGPAAFSLGSLASVASVGEPGIAVTSGGTIYVEYEDTELGSTVRRFDP